VGSSGAQQNSSPLFDPGALSLALTNVVDKLHRKNNQVRAAAVQIATLTLVGFKIAEISIPILSLRCLRNFRVS
jgi:hypothetical protein